MLYENIATVTSDDVARWHVWYPDAKRALLGGRVPSRANPAESQPFLSQLTVESLRLSNAVCVPMLDGRLCMFGKWLPPYGA